MDESVDIDSGFLQEVTFTLLSIQECDNHEF